MVMVITCILFAVLETVVGVLMLMKRSRHNDRSRVLISVFFFLSAFGALFRVAMINYRWHAAVEPQILRVSALLIGFVVYFFLFLYLVEILRPNRLTVGKSILMMSPWLVLVFFLAMVRGGGEAVLTIPTEILPNLTRTDVFLRSLLSVIFIPYGLAVLFMHYNGKSSSAPIGWIKGIVFMAMAMTVTFACNRFLNMQWIACLHIVLYVALTAVILFMELSVRFAVPESCAEEDTESPFPVLSRTSHETVDMVKRKIENVMNDTDVWQNPDFSRDGLCNLVGTNSNYLQKAIKEMGYSSYSDMVNRRRIAFVCSELDADSGENIQDIFYRAGYRSRVTAWRNFTAVTGVAPTSRNPKKEGS